MNHGRVLYSDLTLRYFRSAPHAGVLRGGGVGSGAAGSRESGTAIQFDIQVVDERITATRFLAYGCPHVIAIASWLADQSTGLPARAALPEDVLALKRRFDLPVEKLGRILLVEDAWIAAIRSAVTKSNCTML